MTESVPRESDQNVRRPERRATFPRSGRLLRHADFERVYKQGRRHYSSCMSVFYLPRTETRVAGKEAATVSGLRIGFTVGRALGGAVQRNRMKRRLREAVRLARPAQTPDADVVINPKKVLLTAKFEAVMNEIRQAFVVIEEKLAQKKQAATAPGTGRKQEN